MNKKIYKKIAATIFVLVFTFSQSLFIFPKKAEAGFPVFDWSNFVQNTATAINSTVSAGVDVAIVTKEFGLDTIAWALTNLIIERMTASTVNWINSGFQGSPAYISNPGRYFGNMADQIAGQFIYNHPNLKFLCGPINARIRLALTQNYLREPTWQCTMTQVGRNLENFLDDFRNGGWDNFFQLTQIQQNNPIGAYLQAKAELDMQIANKTILKKQELDYGRGFLTFKTCKRWSNVVGPGQDPGLGGGIGDYIDPETGIPMNTLPDSPKDPTGAQRVCLEEITSTPGSVIQDGLSNILKIGNDKLAVADEINEIVSALLNQAVLQIVGGIGKGLRGLSDRSEGASFTDQILARNAQSQIVAMYFCNDDPNMPNYNPNLCQNPLTQNTDILKQPPPELMEPIREIPPNPDTGQTIDNPFDKPQP